MNTVLAMLSVSGGGGGGGGTLKIYWWGVPRLRHRHGVLGTGTSRKGGGVLGTDTSRKRGVLVTDVAQKGVLGSSFINYPYFFSCQHDQLVGVCSDRLKRGVLGTGQARKKRGGGS